MRRPLSMTTRWVARFALLVGSLVTANLLATDTHPLGPGDFHERLATAHSLPEDLSQDRLQALCAWLVDATHEPGEATLKNDVLNRLRAQKQPVAELGSLLMAMVEDDTMSLTLRDYALQHLGTLPASRLKDTPVSQTLWQATRQHQDSRAGTALLALARRQAMNPEVATRALELARLEEASVQTRIPALLVCGQLGQRGVLPIARALTQHADQSLAMAAIATLGQVGDYEDLQHLSVLQINPSERIIHAALAAYDRLKDRLDGGMSL